VALAAAAHARRADCWPKAAPRRWGRHLVTGWQRAAVGFIALLALAMALFWYLTPSTGGIQARVAAAAAQHHAAVLQPGDVPPALAEAVIATEDERFYQHHGIDVIGLGRALWFDATQQCACQGGSTITEQLAKDLYLQGSDRGPAKLDDMVLALKIESTINKQLILADYLTEVPTGIGLYGVAEASCTYYHRSLAELDLAQYALLAGLPQAPSTYDPRINPRLASERRIQVLQAMASEGYITESAAAHAAAEPLLPPGGHCT
jgi:membrane peptidoglycan carboxypeptidase